MGLPKTISLASLYSAHFFFRATLMRRCASSLSILRNPEMAALVPLFEKQRLTAGFFGHDHNYQHYLKNGVH